MSVLIKGMDMPVIELDWTIRHAADGKWYAIDTNAETSDGAWHEIVPVPKHGRLIDADAFSSEMKERQTAAIKWMRESVQDYDAFIRAEATIAFLSEVKLTLDKMPTVIPAEEGE